MRVTSEQDHGDDLLGVTLGGKYLLEEIIGEGTMGWVYRARQFPLKREVAIKVMRPVQGEDNNAVIARFQREAEVIASLEHPNTVMLYDFGATWDGRVYLVMKYVRGQTLRALLDEQGALPLPRAARILKQTAGSLAEAHEAGITHRDVKPANVMLSDRFGHKDVVTVVDFGVAKNSESLSITGAGQIIGTPAYMAPEIAGGSSAAPMSDMYSLGCMLYEMVSGAPPFGNISVFTTVYKHVNEDPPPLPDDVAQRCGPRVVKLIKKLLHKQPVYRPNCQQLIETLDECLQELTRSPLARSDRLRTMQRLQAARRRQASARPPTLDLPTRGLQVPEASGRTLDHMLDEELATTGASPRRPFITSELATTRDPAEVDKRPSSRSHLPVFRRPAADGQLLCDHVQTTIVVNAVGMALIEITAPAFVSTLHEQTIAQVGVPGEPVTTGLVWAEGRIVKRTETAAGIKLTVELEQRATQPYKNMVEYWGLMQRNS